MTASDHLGPQFRRTSAGLRTHDDKWSIRRSGYSDKSWHVFRHDNGGEEYHGTHGYQADAKKYVKDTYK